MVTRGTLMTFDVAGSSSLFPHTSEGIRSDAIDELSHYFDRIQVSMTTESFTDDPLRMFKPLEYTAVVQAAPLADYADPHDVASIVRNAFYNAAGALPTVTVRGVDVPIGPPKQQTPGLSLTTGLVLIVVGLIAVAVIVVKA
jgi:hypothetical protein